MHGVGAAAAWLRGDELHGEVDTIVAWLRGDGPHEEVSVECMVAWGLWDVQAAGDSAAWGGGGWGGV